MTTDKHEVLNYTTVTAKVTVYFPENDIRCVHCPYLSSNERMCQLNKRPVFYPTKDIGYWCPLFNTGKEEK